MKLPSSRNQGDGFTLIELLVVISIIAILSIIGITVFTTVQKNARDVRRKSDLNAIMQAFAQYVTNNGKIPLSNNCGGNRNLASHGLCVDNSDSPNNWYLGDYLVSHGYLASVPYDPLNGPKSCRYYYYTDAAGQYAQLSATLENPSQADLDTFNKGPIPGSDCHVGNYRIFSSL